MNLKKLVLISILVAVLTGCATNEPTPINSGIYENPAGEALVCRIPLQLESIEPIDWRDFQWKVINRSIAQRMIDDGDDFRYFALSPDDFENLALTQQDILRYLSVQSEQLEQTLNYFSDEVVDE